MLVRRQQGFTLIEVVVAFAIFALSVGALYALFGDSMKRTSQAEQREMLMLVAQSQLTELRARPTKWPAEQTGTTADGLSWRVVASPFRSNIAESSAWRAVHITLTVSDPQRTASAYALESIELVHSSVGSQP